MNRVSMLSFAEGSSGDDFIGNGEETPEEDEKVGTETRERLYIHCYLCFCLSLVLQLI